MPRPYISIIIPVKKEAQMLEKTLPQYVPYIKRGIIEVIVSDDGPDKETSKVARKYASKVVELKADRKNNIAKNRNNAAQHARGDILFSTDADVIIPNKERFFRMVIEKFKDKSLWGMTVPLKFYPKEFNTSKDRFFAKRINEVIKMSFALKIFLAKGKCQIMSKKAFRKVHGYNEQLTVGEDCDLFFRMSKLGRVEYVEGYHIYHSARRFRKNGYLKTFLVYLREAGWLVLFKKNYLKEW